MCVQSSKVKGVQIAQGTLSSKVKRGLSTWFREKLVISKDFQGIQYRVKVSVDVVFLLLKFLNSSFGDRV